MYVCVCVCVYIYVYIYIYIHICMYLQIYIHILLQAGVASAAVKCGPMVMLSLLIQGIFAEELITRHLPVLAGTQVVAASSDL